MDETVRPADAVGFDTSRLAIDVIAEAVKTMDLGRLMGNEPNAAGGENFSRHWKIGAEQHLHAQS